MKDQLSALDLHFLVRELQGLVGARLQKAYQGAKERKRDLLFQLHKTARKGGKEGGTEGEADADTSTADAMAIDQDAADDGASKLLFRVVLPGLAYLSAEKPPVARVPGHFAVFLRKWVGNARLVAVEQRGFEKILELRFENKDGQRTLLLELLPPGNALLLNEQSKIMNLLEPQRHGQRVLRGGAVYEPPPPFFDTKAATEAEIVERLFVSSRDAVVKAVAGELGLGSAYAEEACARAKVEKMTAKPTKAQLAAIATAVKGLFDETSAPRVIGEEAYPFRMATKEEGVPFASFSAAIASLVPEEEPPAAVEARAKKDKSREVVAQQEKALAAYERTAAESQRKGELLYEHYQEVKQLIDGVNALRKEKGWAAVKAKLKGKPVKIDEEKGEITIELE